MDYAKIASQVIEHVGGKENIKSAVHCATRLRLQLRDENLRNEDAISDIEGVKGVFMTQTQFQIIFGSGLVNLVCAEVQKQLGLAAETPEEDEKSEKKGNILQRFVKMLSDIFRRLAIRAQYFRFLQWHLFWQPLIRNYIRLPQPGWITSQPH